MNKLSLLNKKMILEYHDLVFNKHKPKEAMEKYIGNKYIQHNPYSDGKKSSFVSYFSNYFLKYPQFQVSILNCCVDENYAFLHVHTQNFTGDSGEVVVDIYKIEDLRIVEHWDVIQKVEADIVNPNAYF